MAVSWDIISALTCINGHPYGPDSMERTVRGLRCKQCHIEASRRSAQGKKAAREPRPCDGCGAMVDQAMRKRRYCSAPCRSAAGYRRRYQALSMEERQVKSGYVKVPEKIVPCESCWAPIVRHGNQKRRFCPTCNRGKGHRSRAQRYGVPFETVNRTAVFERDGWICRLCNRPVDKGLSWPHTESVSLDHIVPLSRGGAHVDSNVQTAHLGCNIAKGANLINEGA